MLYNNVEIRNGCYGVVHYDTDGNETHFEEKGKEVKLDKVKLSIETGDVTWLVSFDCYGERKNYEFLRNNIAEKKLASALQSKGADITSKSFNSFVDSMRLQEDNIQNVEKTYQRLGWIRIKTKHGFELAYRAHRLIGCNTQAEYCGNVSLQPNGTYENWKALVETDVLGRIPLETIMLASLSAPVVGICGINTSTENPIYHISGLSGTGKSTACALAASVSGEPYEGSKNTYNADGIEKQSFSVFGSWGATPKATITSHAGNRGVVAILNELGKYQGTDMSVLIFNMSEGSDIKRLNTQLHLNLSEGFNTVFISNGEMSLLGRCKSKLEGLKNRILEITVPLTDDAEHSRRIKDACVQNNGFAAPMIAEHICNHGGYDYVKELRREVLQQLSTSAPPKISARFVEKFPTLLVVTAKIAEEALGIKFNVQKVVDFCYACALKTIKDAGDVDASYQDVIGECSVHRSNFYVRGAGEPQQCWGAIKYPNTIEGNKKVVMEYGLKPSILKDILTKHGHPNLDTCVAIWKKAGVLNHEKGRNTRDRQTTNVKGVTEELYVLKVYQDCDPSEMTTPKKVKSNLASVKARRSSPWEDDDDDEEDINNNNSSNDSESKIVADVEDITNDTKEASNDGQNNQALNS